MQTSPNVALERVTSRARREERNICIQYLTQLNNLHEEWIAGLQEVNMLGETDLQVYTIDADQPMDRMYAQYESCLQFLDMLNA